MTNSTVERREQIATFALAATVVLFVCQIPIFAGGGWGHLSSVLWHHAWLLAVVLVVSWPTRTVALRTVVMHFFLGLYPVSLAAIFGGGVLLWVTDALSIRGLAESLLVPTLEELLKVLPVVLYFAVSTRRRGLRLAAIDGLVLGVAVGSGFSLHEEMAAGRSVGQGLSLTPLGLLLPTAAKIGGGFAGPPVRWIAGHAGWAALAGLAIGMSAFRRPAMSPRSRNWVFAAVGVGLVILDHASVNYQGTGEHFFDRLFLAGLLVPLVLLIAVVCTVAFEWLELREARREHADLPPIPLARQLALLPPKNLAALLELRLIRTYQRARRAAYLTLGRWQHQPPKPEVAVELLTRVAALGVVAGAWSQEVAVSDPDVASAEVYTQGDSDQQ